MKIRWTYLLILLPAVTGYLEKGHLSSLPQDYITEVSLTLVIGLLVALINRQYKRLESLAETDQLTGLYNRHRFHADLQREFKRSKRQSYPLTLAFLDIDNFKAINDNHGHAEGDVVLARFSVALKKMVREEMDSCYRIGGDEFCVLMPNVDEKTATPIVDRISRNHCDEDLCLEKYQAGVSVGVVSRQETESPDELLKRADRLMYQSKQAAKRSQQAAPIQ